MKLHRYLNMAYKKKIKIVIVALGIMTVGAARATSVGGDTSAGVTRATRTEITDADNIINGFAYMEDGFFFTPDADITCSFNSVFPVGGAIYLHSGRLYVLQDLTLRGTASLLTTGTVITSSRIQLAPAEHTETGSINWDLNNGSLDLHGWTSLSSSWTFSGTGVFNGNGNTLDLNHPTSVITIGQGSNITFCNMTIDGLSDMKIQGHGGAASLTFDNVEVRLNGDYTLTGASFAVKHDMRISGKGHTFTYTAPYQSQVHARSRLYVDHDVTFSYDTSFVGAVSDMKTQLSFADNTSEFHLNGCTLHITLTGFKMTTGTMLIENDVIFDIDGIEDYQVMELDSSISTKILAGATMDVRGKLKYV